MITFSQLGQLGRLGNQMFQVAACYAKARTLAVPLMLRQSAMLNGLWWSKLSDDPAVILADDDKFAANLAASIPSRWTERTFSLDASFNNIESGTDLSGYLQSEKYFQEFSDSIAEAFSPSPTTLGADFGHWQQSIVACKEPTLAVHVRRGDYVGRESYHTDLAATGYYSRALTLIRSRIAIPPRAFVFSDDLRFASELLSGADPSPVSSLQPHEDLMLMSQCDHQIIANSSFSWWAAWLAEARETGGVQEQQRRRISSPRTIVAPQRWFAQNGPKDIGDLVPDRWALV